MAREAVHPRRSCTALKEPELSYKRAWLAALFLPYVRNALAWDHPLTVSNAFLPSNRVKR